MRQASFTRRLSLTPTYLLTLTRSNHLDSIHHGPYDAGMKAKDWFIVGLRLLGMWLLLMVCLTECIYAAGSHYKMAQGDEGMYWFHAAVSLVLGLATLIYALGSPIYSTGTLRRHTNVQSAATTFAPRRKNVRNAGMSRKGRVSKRE